MAQAKAKKIESYKDKFFSTVVYEYRGCLYEVTYANGWQVCCTPAWIQHRDEQAKIDEMLDNPKPITGVDELTGEPIKPIAEQMDEIWEMMGW